MAIISDGTTDITVEFADEVYDPLIERATRQTVGGKLKSQTSGERFQVSVRMRVSQAEFRSILNLLTNGSTSYFYTPTDQLATLYPAITYPLEVEISNIESTFDNKKVFYIKFDIRGVDYV